jgi:hypothetical protein
VSQGARTARGAGVMRTSQFFVLLVARTAYSYPQFQRSSVSVYDITKMDNEAKGEIWRLVVVEDHAVNVASSCMQGRWLS